MCSADQEARFAKFRDRKHRIGIQNKMSLLLELTGLIAKDVVRTDRHLEYFKEPDSDALKKLSDILITYSFYNFDLGKRYCTWEFFSLLPLTICLSLFSPGYVQGMNDLLAPILFVMGDEADAFWCFKSLMDSMVLKHCFLSFSLNIFLQNRK